MASAASVLLAPQIQLMAEDELITIFPKFKMPMLRMLSVRPLK